MASRRLLRILWAKPSTERAVRPREGRDSLQVLSQGRGESLQGSAALPQETGEQGLGRVGWVVGTQEW